MSRQKKINIVLLEKASFFYKETNKNDRADGFSFSQSTSSASFIIELFGC